ncbi:hypothetical protein [Salinispora arenicola]|uniref:hypothetical protein n=1 Tax=Salinispora arenicola TaxID=168697 RepID=UPI0012BCE856|nr:hypothetical protein [Salinispora arenicola]
MTSKENRFSAWQVAVVFMAAALASFMASLEEIRQVGQVWLDCEMDSGGMGGYLMMFHLPVLFFGQTALLGASGNGGDVGDSSTICCSIDSSHSWNGPTRFVCFRVLQLQRLPGH